MPTSVQAVNQVKEDYTVATDALMKCAKEQMCGTIVEFKGTAAFLHIVNELCKELRSTFLTCEKAKAILEAKIKQYEPPVPVTGLDEL